MTGFETGLAKLARVNDDAPLVGRVVERVESRGKWLLIYFSGDLILVTHMLMSGSWHLYRAGERWRMGAVEDAGGDSGGWVGRRWRFNVPIAEFHTARSLERSSQVPKLGPDVLADEFTVEGGVARLAAYAAENPEAEIGVVLLNQRVLAGLGNVYKSEVAFAAGVNPFRAMRTVTPERDGGDGGVCAAVYEGECCGWKGEGIVTCMWAIGGRRVRWIGRSGFGCIGGRGRSAGGAGRR